MPIFSPSFVVNPQSKPNTDGAPSALNTATPPASSPAGVNSVGQNKGVGQQLASNQQSVQSNNAPQMEANIPSGQDYIQRASQIYQNNNRQKISLVGRTGAGARPLTADLSPRNDINSIQNNGQDIFSVVVFEATPDMSESGQTILVDVGDIRAAASVVIYLGSPSRSFKISAKFVSRTPEEASMNMKYINILKAWREPVLKQGSQFGAEPETLRLFAYNDVLKGIPVMIWTLDIEYPSDVDYILSAEGDVWVPIIQNVSIGLKEVRSVDDLATFDYESFKAGKLDQW